MYIGLPLSLRFSLSFFKQQEITIHLCMMKTLLSQSIPLTVQAIKPLDHLMQGQYKLEMQGPCMHLLGKENRKMNHVIFVVGTFWVQFLWKIMVMTQWSNSRSFRLIFRLYIFKITFIITFFIRLWYTFRWRW